MAAAFEVIERTESGKAKVEYAGIGTTGYRDLEAGDTIKQQSFAAAKGNEKSEFERDEDGKFTSREVVDDAEEDDEDDAEEDDEDDDEEDDEEEGTPFNYRNLVYGGLIYDNSNTDIQISVWNINEEPDSSVTFEELRSSWWKNAKGICYDEIGPIADDVEVRGTEGDEGPATKKIDPDEVRPADRPVGKVKGSVILQKGSKVYEYGIDFTARELVDETVAVPDEVDFL